MNLQLTNPALESPLLLKCGCGHNIHYQFEYSTCMRCEGEGGWTIGGGYWDPPDFSECKDCGGVGVLADCYCDCHRCPYCDSTGFVKSQEAWDKAGSSLFSVEERNYWMAKIYTPCEKCCKTGFR